MPHPARRPSARSGDHRSGAFTTEDLDMLTARAGLTPPHRLRIRAAAATARRDREAFAARVGSSARGRITRRT